MDSIQSNELYRILEMSVPINYCLSSINSKLFDYAVYMSSILLAFSLQAKFKLKASWKKKQYQSFTQKLIFIRKFYQPETKFK